MEKFTIGTRLRKILIENTGLKALIKDRIYPIIAPLNTRGSFITYCRNSYSKVYAKNILVAEHCNVIFTIVSDDYNDSQKIAAMVSDALENYLLEDNTNVRLVESSEDFTEDKYIQELNFKIE